MRNNIAYAALIIFIVAELLISIESLLISVSISIGERDILDIFYICAIIFIPLFNIYVFCIENEFSKLLLSSIILLSQILILQIAL